MLGPVFSLELRLAVRRGRLNALRYVYGGWWVLQFALLFLMLFRSEIELASPRAGLGPFLNLSFQIFVAQHFIFLVLATPAFVAGAITDEKSQGTLHRFGSYRVKVHPQASATIRPRRRISLLRDLEACRLKTRSLHPATRTSSWRKRFRLALVGSAGTEGGSLVGRYGNSP
jgi:hypothetical protein